MQPAGPSHTYQLAILRLCLLAGLLLVGIASTVHAGQAGSAFTVSVNFVAGGSGSCGLLSGPNGNSYVACGSVPIATARWFSAQIPQIINQTGADYANQVGPYQRRGTLDVFAPAASTDTRWVVWNGRNYLEMTLGW